MKPITCIAAILAGLIVLESCNSNPPVVQTVQGEFRLGGDERWLSHEHLLVDFIGADSVKKGRWDSDTVVHSMLPFLDELNRYEIDFFVDATPNYLARDVHILKQLSIASGIKIITNTGFYGAVKDKYIPDFAYEMSAKQISELWIREFSGGIDGTDVKPGFIKISVDPLEELDEIDAKLVEAAALTHLKTGLTIGSHTGPAKALYPQLSILQDFGVSPESFIWIHAQNEKDPSHYLKAAGLGCWISLDGLGWEIDNHIEKLVYARENGILQHILISHDAGWYDPAKKKQDIKPYTNIFTEVIPRLKQAGFTTRDLDLILKTNPAEAFAIRTRLN